MHVSRLSWRHLIFGVLAVVFVGARLWREQFHALLAAEWAVRQADSSDAAVVALRVLLQAGDWLGALPWWLVVLAVAAIWQLLSKKN